MAEGKVKVSNFCEVARKYMSVLYGVATWQSAVIDLGLSAREMVALVVHKVKVHYWLHGLRLDDLSEILWGLNGRDLTGQAYATAQLSEPSMYVLGERKSHMLTSGGYIEDPEEYDFTNLPGGGLIIPAKPLYFSVAADNLGGSNCPMLLEMHFDVVELDQANLLDLVQVMHGYP
jgi:hypothetical protein